MSEVVRGIIDIPSRLVDELWEPGWKVQARLGVAAGKICPACLGVGWQKTDERVGHPEFGKLYPCPVCSSGQISQYLRDRSGLVGWQAAARFSSYLATEDRRAQFAAAKAALEKGWGWLTFWGGYGTGKSYLLSAVVNEALEARKPAVYVTAGKVLDHLRDAYRPGGLGFSAAFQNWASIYLLAVDEADVFQSTDWALDKYRQLLDHRYNEGAARRSLTILACNPRPGGDKWPEGLDWLASRMHHFDVVEAEGGDIRPKLHEADQWQDRY